MNYCETCRLAVAGEVCPVCGNDLLRPVCGEDYCFLTAKEEMWAKLLRELLENHRIPAAMLPVLGAGVWMKSGQPERYQIYVPYARLEQAEALLELAFGETVPS